MTDISTFPTGTVTFLFTDIEGSTKLAQQYPDDMPALMARHHELLHRAIQAQNGYVFQIIGDAFCAAFHSPAQAIDAAVHAQRLLHEEPWKPAPIRGVWGFTPDAPKSRRPATIRAI